MIDLPTEYFADYSVPKTRGQLRAHWAYWKYVAFNKKHPRQSIKSTSLCGYFLILCMLLWLISSSTLFLYFENVHNVLNPLSHEGHSSKTLQGGLSITKGRFKVRNAESRTEVDQLMEHRQTSEVKPTVASEHLISTEERAYAEFKTIYWVLPVYASIRTLKNVLKSYSNANITKNVLLVKHVISPQIDSVIRHYADEIEFEIIDNSYAWAQFRKDNVTYNYTEKCSKHYWWWFMNMAWEDKPDAVCLMADDIVVERNTIKWTQIGLTSLHDKHIGLRLHVNLTTPLCLRDQDWRQIRSHQKDFFDNEDYRWYPSFARTFLGNKTVLIPSEPIVKPVTSASRTQNFISTASFSFKESPILPLSQKSITKIGLRNTFCMKHRHCSYLSYKPTIRKGVWINSPNSDYIIEVRNASLDMAKVEVTKGGELVSDVMGRKESDEFPKYSIGAWTVPSFKQFTNLKKYQAKIFKAAVAGKPKSCEAYFVGTTVAYERVNYANFYFTINDWFKMHTTFNLFNLTSANILWLDGHPKGHFDDIWSVLFNSKIDRIGGYNRSICFERLIFMPARESPLYHHKIVKGCTINDFVRRVKRSFNVKPNGTKHDTIIERRPYLAHPRTNGKTIDRTLANMDEVRRAFPDAKVVRMEMLSFIEQLQIIVNTKTLYGVHGAGLSWGLFLEPGSKLVEWVPSSRADTLSFQQFDSWRPDLTYERVMLKPVRGDLNSWRLPVP